MGRSTIESTPRGLRITINTRKGAGELIQVAFFSVWMVGWFFGEVSAIRSLIGSGGKNFGLFIWLVGWTAGGVFIAINILWRLAGKEVITVSASVISLEKRLIFWGNKESYNMHDVKDLRVIQAAASAPLAALSGRSKDVPRGKLAFDYGPKTVRFAAGIDDDEAGFLLAKMGNAGTASVSAVTRAGDRARFEKDSVHASHNTDTLLGGREGYERRKFHKAVTSARERHSAFDRRPVRPDGGRLVRVLAIVSAAVLTALLFWFLMTGK